MDKNTHNLKKFFEKALRIQAQNQNRLSEAERKEIAESLGFSQADWQAVLDSFTGHLERAKAFLERNNYIQAIAELEEALILQPEHPDTLAYAASAYLGLYRHTKKKADQEKAITYAKDCLLLSPQHPLAHQVLDAFNPTKTPSNLQALRQAKETSRQKPQQTSAKSPSTDRAKPIREVAIFASVMAGIGLLFWLSFPSKSPQTKPAAPSAPAVVSTSNPKPKTTNRYERILEPQPLALELMGSSTGWQAIPQNANTWLIQDAKGQALFSLHKHDLEWIKEIHGWQDQTWKGKKKYNFYSKGILLLKVSTSQLSTSLRFSAKLLKTNDLKFHSYLKNQTIGLDLMPLNLRIPQDHWLLLPFQLSTLQKGLSFEEDLPFPLTEVPAKLQIELGKAPASPSASELGAPLPVFYQGKPYSELSLRPLGQATGWALDGSIFSYRWAFSLKHQNGNRQLKSLKLRILFFDRDNRSIGTYTEGWSSSEAWSTNFPPLPAGQAALQGFMHDLKGIANVEEVVRKEVIIEELVWD